jgi:hypothetical protein
MMKPRCRPSAGPDAADRVRVGQADRADLADRVDQARTDQVAIGHLAPGVQEVGRAADPEVLADPADLVRLPKH